MIREVTGDILLSDAQLIAHGVAPNDHFKQGLALELRKRWPAMAKDFRHYSHANHPKEGGIWTWGSAGVRIANLLTQEHAPNQKAHPGKATTANVNHALKALRKFVEDEGISSVALPRLATGVGGLDWEKDVKPLVEHHLGDMNVPVYVYARYEPGQKANEG